VLFVHITVVKCERLKMVHIIKYGFKCVNYDLLRPATLRKGYNLAQSNHVSDVMEIAEEEESKITARVLPQTSVTNTPYSISLEVSFEKIYMYFDIFCILSRLHVSIRYFLAI